MRSTEWVASESRSQAEPAVRRPIDRLSGVGNIRWRAVQ